MESTLLALGKLLIQSIPTILFFILLTFYLKYVFFKPMAKILEERRRATEGVRNLAQRAFEEAEKKNSEFETALQIARAEIHQEQEAIRRRWLEEQAQAVAKARAEADQRIEEAKREIAEQAQQAQRELDKHVESLSEQIVNTLSRRRAA